MGQHEYVVAIDLELNQRDTGPKIIEIGVAIGHHHSRKIIETHRIFVNPNEEITEYIRNLTGITQNMVQNAPDIVGAYDQLKNILSRFDYRKMPIEWGAGDSWTLRKELMAQNRGVGEDWCFGWTTMNVKNLVQAILDARGSPIQGGLAKSMNKFGIRFQGEKHRAGDDAKNTLLLYWHLLKSLEKL